MLACGCGDGSVRVLDVKQPAPILGFSHHQAEVNGVDFNHKLTHLLATASWDSSVTVCDVLKGAPVCLRSEFEIELNNE